MKLVPAVELNGIFPYKHLYINTISSIILGTLPIPIIIVVTDNNLLCKVYKILLKIP